MSQLDRLCVRTIGRTDIEPTGSPARSASIIYNYDILSDQRSASLLVLSLFTLAACKGGDEDTSEAGSQSSGLTTLSTGETMTSSTGNGTGSGTGSGTETGTSMGTGTGSSTMNGTTMATTSVGETETDTETDTETGTDSGGVDCLPPDMLIALDRTLSMHRTPDGFTPIDGPDYASSKWSQAITAVEGLVAPPTDNTVRFGLELWPRDDGGCITLAERVTDSKQTTNALCDLPEIVVDNELSTGLTITDLLDPTTTTLCKYTPTGTALVEAGAYLDGIKEPMRGQYITLITDGSDWDKSCPDPAPLKVVQDLEKAGIKTYVVGFDGQESEAGATAFLNQLACAGKTANAFPGPCYEGPDGWTAFDVEEPAPVYLQADNAEDLTSALKAITDEVCCGCSKGCDAPEVLFSLDRTLSMHKTTDGGTPIDAPQYESSKWYQAITAIEEVTTTAGLDSKLRFGLELWPKDSLGCITLAERVTDSKDSANVWCESGEILVPPQLKAGNVIDPAIDPAATKLCQSTPTGNGLLTAYDWHVSNATPGRDQYVVLVTDGADWDKSCPTPDPLAIVQKLASAGIKTYVVGFFGEEEQIAAGYLNSLACAGQTAKDFPLPCETTENGWIATDPDAVTPLYLKAGKGELPMALADVADEIASLCVPG